MAERAGGPDPRQPYERRGARRRDGSTASIPRPPDAARPEGEWNPPPDRRHAQGLRDGAQRGAVRPSSPWGATTSERGSPGASSAGMPGFARLDRGTIALQGDPRRRGVPRREAPTARVRPVGRIRFAGRLLGDESPSRLRRRRRLPRGPGNPRPLRRGYGGRDQGGRDPGGRSRTKAAERQIREAIERAFPGDARAGRGGGGRSHGRRSLGDRSHRRHEVVRVRRAALRHPPELRGRPGAGARRLLPSRPRRDAVGGAGKRRVPQRTPDPGLLARHPRRFGRLLRLAPRLHGLRALAGYRTARRASDRRPGPGATPSDTRWSPRAAWTACSIRA